MKKILIVDDNSIVRELVEATLGSEEYAILHAESGVQAVETTRAEHPDLILMDIMMPGELDGLDATRQIKEDPETGRIPIVMLTAKGQDVDRKRGYEAGADEYFIKPFSPLELIRKVEDLLH